MRGFALIFEEKTILGPVSGAYIYYRPGLDVVLAVCNQRPRPGGAGMQTADVRDNVPEVVWKDVQRYRRGCEP